MQLNGVIPYWMNHARAVKNDVVIDGMIFLTGSNMGGKSTIMRYVWWLYLAVIVWLFTML
jgi:DNA mismatch repair ATPase MutS